MGMIGWLFHVAIETKDPARTLAFVAACWKT
jgi:hypothetical protein